MASSVPKMIRSPRLALPGLPSDLLRALREVPLQTAGRLVAERAQRDKVWRELRETWAVIGIWSVRAPDAEPANHNFAAQAADRYRLIAAVR